MPGVKDLIADSEFNALPLAQQREALSRFDPSFSNLNDQQINEFKLKINKPIDVKAGVKEYGNETKFPLLGDPRTTGIESNPRFNQFVNFIRPIVERGMQDVPPLVGGMVGGVPGAIAGGVLGDIASQGAREPTQPISPKEAILNGLASGAVQGGTNLGFAGLDKVKAAIFKGLINPSTAADVAAQKGFAAFPQLNPTASELKPSSRFLQLIEDLGAPLKKRQRLQEQQGLAKDTALDISAGFNPSGTREFPTPDITAGAQRTTTKEGLKQLTRIENNAFDVSRLIARGNTINHNGVDVEGPIILKNTINIADKEVQRRHLLSQYGTLDPLKIVTDEDKQVAGAYRDLLSAMEIDPKTNIPLRDAQGQLIPKPIGYDLALQIKRNTGKLGGFGEVRRDIQERQFAGLNKAADTDIRESFPLWKSNGDVALKNYDVGNKVTQKIYGTYLQAPVENLLKGPNSGAAEMRQALSDPNALNRMLASGRDRRPLQSEAVSDIFAGAFDDASKEFNGNSALEEWHKRENLPIFRKLFNATDRSNLENFFTTIKGISQKLTFAGAPAAAFRIAGAGIYVGGGVLSGKLFDGNISTGELYSLGVLGLAIGTNQFTRKVLLNPKIARMATSGFKSTVGSGEAHLATKAILQSLSGETVRLVTQNGEIPVEVKDGKLQLPH